MKLDLLLGTHRPGDPAEATLVLMAVSAIRGRRGDGNPMTDYEPTGRASINRIANEAGISRKAASRGLAHLLEHDQIEVFVDTDGVTRIDASNEVLAARWKDYRRRVRLPAAVRRLRLRCNTLLLVGLVLAQIRPGESFLRLGRRHLAERLGLTPRRVDRAIAAAKRAGVLQTWTYNNVLHLQVELPKKTSESSAQADSSDVESGNPGGAKAANPLGPNRQSTCSKAANAIRISPGLHPDQHPDAAPPPAETRSRPEAAPAADTPSTTDPVRAVVEPWVIALTTAGIFQFDANDEDHRARVAGLIQRIPGSHPPDFGADLNRRTAYYREQFAFAGRLCRWAQTPEELARWLVRVADRRTVTNLVAYLRVAARAGDPGSLLRSTKKNQAGRAAETWQDFSPATETALEGNYANEVERLVTAGSQVMATTSPAKRTELLKELRQMLSCGRRAAARAVLLQIVGQQPTDAQLQASVGEVLSVSEARRLLVA